VILRWDSDIPPGLKLGGESRLAGRFTKNSNAAGKANGQRSAAQMLFMLRKRPFTTAETEEIKSGIRLNDWSCPVKLLQD
jgi:hypothetical protein